MSGDQVVYNSNGSPLTGLSDEESFFIEVINKNPGKIKHRSPELGEHNQQILMELGYTQEEINQLKKDRII